MPLLEVGLVRLVAILIDVSSVLELFLRNVDDIVG